LGFKYIKNSENTLTHGVIPLRKAALKIIDHGIYGGDPGIGTFKKVYIEDDTLHVGEKKFDLSTIGRIFVLGTGKGSYPIASALEDILGDKIYKGFLAVKKGETRRLKRIEVMEAGHPIPDENSIEAGRRLIALADEVQAGDLAFLAVTGGCSALSISPPGEVTLEDYQRLTDLLLGSGAIIRDINAVRKHLCQLKGGRFVSRVQPGTALTLTLDTQPKGMLWPDMSLPDISTFADALNVLKDTGIWDKVPASARKYLAEGLKHPEWETLKSLENMNAYLVSVGDQIQACESAAKKAAELGFKAHILSTSIQGEAVVAGRVLAGLTREIILRDRPFQAPCALISSGEMTVSLGNKIGLGGPNQEFVLSFASEIEPLERFTCASVDTDGTDGPTEIAGGISDGMTFERIKKMGLNVDHFLKEHTSTDLLGKLQDQIITGHTGTNVLNLRLVLVAPKK